uniref:Uncharacterized protein n=1 Tax=Rhizophora mucronata TaxID=61149 RepID=A0A2P2J253_RHIMU
MNQHRFETSQSNSTGDKTEKVFVCKLFCIFNILLSLGDIKRNPAVLVML